MEYKLIAGVLKNAPAYRFRQIQKLIFHDFISDWSEATTLPQNLRTELESASSLSLRAKLYKSRDQKTVRALLTFTDGAQIETVLMRHGEKRRTICLSSQVGCSLGCSFCATGKLGLTRNLSRDEIIDQVLFWGRYLKTEYQEKISNIVFMGMGEPFLNYEAVLAAIKMINDPEYLNIGARHISISTAGIIDGIKKLAKTKLQVNLAISLHAPTDILRTQLMPINKRFSLAALLRAVDNYIEISGRRVMFEYILIKNVNDSPAAAQELALIMKRPLVMVNLILYNDTGVFAPTEKERIKEFKNILTKAGVAVTERYRFGTEMAAACGQLALKNQK